MEVMECVNGSVINTATRPRCHELASCKATPESNGERQCTCNNGLVGDGINTCERKLKLLIFTVFVSDLLC